MDENLKHRVLRIAGVIVLYNPEDFIFQNIFSCARQVDFLYVVDNSDIINKALVLKISQLENIKYLRNNGNQGIANALNLGAYNAIKDDFDHLLTLDQDTILLDDYVSKIILEYQLCNYSEIGIFAPNYLLTRNHQRWEVVKITMTSGNLLNLRVYSKVGPFLDWLFIDHVDHEFCLRLNKFGFKVVQANEVILQHAPGAKKRISLLGMFEFKLTFNSPLRLYYFTRNGFMVSYLYKGRFVRLFLKLLLKEIIKTPFLADSILRIKMIVMGYVHFKRNQFGKFES